MNDRTNIDIFSTCIHILNLMELAKNELHTEDTEKNILSCLKKNPKAARLSNKSNKTLGMIAAEYGLLSVVDEVLKDGYASIQQDEQGKNIGMYLAEYALKFNYKANIYTYNSDYIDNILIKALKNKPASIQQDKNGNNIGMLAVQRNSKRVTKVVLKNVTACSQKNMEGKTVIDILNKIKERESYFNI